MAAKDGKKIVIVRKKKVSGGGHHGGSWKVAYADFVTAMMAFFMVMWILGMDDKVKQAVEGYFSNPVGYKKGYGAGASPIASGTSPAKAATQQVKILMRSAESQNLERVAAQIRQIVSGDASLKQLKAKVEVSVAKDGLRIELVESGDGATYFPVGSTTMKPATVIALRLIAPAIASLGNAVVIEGHTDAVAYGAGSGYNNWDLSAERANAARRVLEASGLPAARVDEVRGMADRHLRVPDDPYAAANRRITILLPYRSQPPRADEPPPAGGMGELASASR
jgi:chemotaxis protein MotB